MKISTEETGVQELQEHPNGLTRVKILEATGEGADLAVAGEVTGGAGVKSEDE
jgi:hypothetical protein